MIIPRLTVSDICGAKAFYNTRVPRDCARWVFDSHAIADASTGSQLVITGDMPIICSAGTATPSGLSLVKDTGFNIGASIYTYQDENTRLDMITRLTKRGFRALSQHVHPEHAIPPERSIVKPSLLSYLNNKENLPEFVPRPFLPQRTISARKELLSENQLPHCFPIVLKAATDRSSGGGVAVHICRNKNDWHHALENMQTCVNIVVEEYLSIKLNLCLNYAIFYDGRIEYIGAAEQIIGPTGRYQGNWLGHDIVAPQEIVAIGNEIMSSAYNLGYRGFSGMDVAILDDGQFRVYDLNFRANGSTTPLLIFDCLARSIDRPLAMFRSWIYEGSYNQLIATARFAIDQHHLIPFNTFDPVAAGYPDERPRLFGLLFGHSHDNITKEEKLLTQLGLL